MILSLISSYFFSWIRTSSWVFHGQLTFNMGYSAIPGCVDPNGFGYGNIYRIYQMGTSMITKISWYCGCSSMPYVQKHYHLPGPLLQTCTTGTCFLLLPGVCQFLTKRGIRRIPEIKTSRIMVALQPVYREPVWGPLQWSSCSKSSFERLTIAK